MTLRPPRRSPFVTLSGARLAPALAVLVGLQVLAACADSGSGSTATGGTVIVATQTDPDILLPAITNQQQSLVVAEQLFDRLADMGEKLNAVGDAGFTPRLARSWTWAGDSLSIAFALNPLARWHDGVPVRAADVRFTFALYTDTLTAAPFGSLLAGIDSVTVRDSLTAVFWFKRRSPQQFFDATYQMYIHPEHLLGSVPRNQLRSAAFGRAPVGSGRFRFVKWDADSRLEIASDTGNYAGRARLDRVIFSKTSDYQATVNKLFTHEVDVVDNLRPETVPLLAARPELRFTPYRSLSYGFLQFALRDNGSTRAHRLFGDPALRRAIVLATDRQGMLRSIFDSLAALPVAPAPRALIPDDSGLGLPAFDPGAAALLLDSLGWQRSGADGMRARRGVPLRFAVMVPGVSRNRVRFATLLQAQLRAAGVQVDIETVEPPVFIDRLTKRTFDAVINALTTDPTPASVRQSWGSATALLKDGANHGSYMNPVFDALVDSGTASWSPVASRRYYARAYRVMNADAPAIWLYEPPNAIATHARLQFPRPRAIGWWVGLADWSIPPAQRIARDRAIATSKR